MLMEKTKETYYEALQASSTGWHEKENNYEPFVKYYLGIMLKAYNEFESRIEHLKHRNYLSLIELRQLLTIRLARLPRKKSWNFA